MFRNIELNEQTALLLLALTSISTISAYALYRFHRCLRKTSVNIAIAAAVDASVAIAARAPDVLDVQTPAGVLLEETKPEMPDARAPVVEIAPVIPEIKANVLADEKVQVIPEPIAPKPATVLPISIFLKEDKKPTPPPIPPKKPRNTCEPLIDAIRCPISLEIMEDPVMTMDGHTYDRKAIVEWFASGHTTSPLTNVPLQNRTLLPNYAMKGLIEKIVSLSPDPKKTRNEIEVEQRQIANLLQPLDIYAHATGLQALLKTHQCAAQQMSLKLRTELYILNRCESNEMQDKIKFISDYITKSKPNKDKGDYIKALVQVEKNIKTYYTAKLAGMTALRFG